MSTNKMGVFGDKNLRLMRALAQELRLPLIQIARKSELDQLKNDPTNLKDIEVTAGAALRLIDSYLFTTEILLGQQHLNLEPVSASAILYDTAEYLRGIARLYDCNIDIDHSRNPGLVMAHPEALKSAMTSLAYTFITSSEKAKNQRITLNLKKTGSGVVVGVSSPAKILQRGALSSARKFFGLSKQPIRELTANSGAGIYVADSLFNAMEASLKITKYKHGQGMSAVLLPSHQLSFL